MKPIHSTLKKWIKDNETFKKRHEQIKQEIMSHPEIVQFLSSHSQLTETVIQKNLNKLYEYMTQSKNCQECRSLNTCNNMIKGYTPRLYVENNDIHLTYEKCTNRLRYEKEKDERNLIKSFYMPKSILQARFEELDYDDVHRREAISEVLDFLQQAEHALPRKGIYFTGPFGVGKTYFLGALANKLQEHNISTIMIYMPEFVRMMRDAIKDDSVHEKIDRFKAVDVLMLDDIGAETQSAWFRDEVLGSILQHRMMEGLPVFFTSNYTMAQLEKILAKSTRGEIEEVKAGRIMERIRQVSKEVIISGENRRNNNQ